MQPLQRADVSTDEWRWVAFWAGVLVTLTLVPYAWAMAASNSDWAFMGALANPQDSATYFSKIQQGMEGNWLYQLRYTPEEHEAAGLFTFYLLLGHVARFLGFSAVVIFHLARIATSLLMFTSFYWLGAHIWRRLRPRRLFFMLTSVASGLGWLAILFVSDPDNLPPDLSIPEAFPLYAAYANPHFPLSIACLAFLAGIFLEVLRPGYDEAPRAENGGLFVLVISIILAIIQPPALASIAGALILMILITALREREIPWHEIRWGSMIWLPALPIGVYYWLVFSTNDVMGEFNQQNVTESPSILLTILGFGVLLVIAIPGILRAVRRFERDGDQFMLLWLVFNSVALYAPYELQRRFFIGLIIPLTFFAVRAVEDYWYERIAPRWRPLTLVLAFVLMLPSNILALGIPLVGTVADQELGADVGIVVEQDYVDVYEWLDEVGTKDEVVLAATKISLWIPARTNLRVVYGHPFESVPADRLETLMQDFFSGRDCATVLSPQEVGFSITYVVWGPKEREIALEAREDTPDREYQDCIAYMFEEEEISPEQIKTFGDVTLYTLRELR
ncbi:MAG: hypothetical protein GYB66_08710 [Chloroflexi bacterium]|nr:hypothetical protein [Chloroflexota bacterium]